MQKLIERLKKAYYLFKTDMVYVEFPDLYSFYTMHRDGRRYLFTKKVRDRLNRKQIPSVVLQWAIKYGLQINNTVTLTELPFWFNGRDKYLRYMPITVTFDNHYLYITDFKKTPKNILQRYYA